MVIPTYSALNGISVIPTYRALNGISVIPTYRALNGISVIPNNRALNGISVIPNNRALNGFNVIPIYRALNGINIKEYPHDSNLTINIILNVLIRYTDSLPPTLYLQLDNTARENKNLHVFSFLSLSLSLIVELNIFKKMNKSLSKITIFYKPRLIAISYFMLKYNAYTV